MDLLIAASGSNAAIQIVNYLQATGCSSKRFRFDGTTIEAFRRSGFRRSSTMEPVREVKVEFLEGDPSSVQAQVYIMEDPGRTHCSIFQREDGTVHCVVPNQALRPTLLKQASRCLLCTAASYHKLDHPEQVLAGAR